MFDDVTIAVASGTIVVTNKYTNMEIFSAPLNDIQSGTCLSENMPGVPGQINGAELYASKCSLCHGDLAGAARWRNGCPDSIFNRECERHEIPPTSAYRFGHCECFDP
jgi:hypothetical protein